jgi:hypothetical protein
MSTYTYSGAEGAKAAVAQANMLNEGVDLVPTIASANADAVRDAILAEVAAALSGSGSDNFTSLAGYVALGASPPATGGVRVDSATYGNVGFHSRNTTCAFTIEQTATYASVGTASNHVLYIFGSGANKWSVSGTATVSKLGSSSATAHIIGGSTNGLAIRNSGDTRDNLQVNDAGTVTLWNSASYTTSLEMRTLSGEIPAGTWFGSNSALTLIPYNSNAANRIQLAYWINNTGIPYSALEVANTASGFGTLALMKSGGAVVIGGSGTPTAGAAITHKLSVTASGGNAYGMYANATLVAAANTDVLRQKYIVPAFTPGAFTGLTARGLEIAAFSVATFTTPSDPAGVVIGAVTGTGATNAFGILVAPPTGAGTGNYLFSHTTPATFSIAGTGAIISASSANFGGQVTASSAVAVPAAGALNAAILMSSTAGLGVYFGSGAPTVAAAKGSLYIRTDGSGVNDRAYIATNGTGTWTAIVTVA